MSVILPSEKRYSCPLDSVDDSESKVRIRNCSLCSNKVYDFENLNQIQIDTLVLSGEGENKEDPTYFLREDGMYMVNDCPKGWRHQASVYKWYFLLLVVTALIIFKFKDVGHTCDLGADNSGWVNELGTD